ncbi:WD domain-containing protein [Trypanosoma rangeli]|uniref:WD domain-containing protein n=1 Tax=Trypanosoma rangeli TaxID=5698 RepID=A0A3R7NL29_TRYRA|nr:WD domain-containing protein [Trypanosoma rangeli]RNF04206.1 WD domain-containing protein [Trypanosoma rangeli]|eukprot:RNF04206.1 WD domain-containing protein [Trypanosoma rangeli]
MVSARSSVRRGSESAARQPGALVEALDPLNSQPFRPSLVLTFRGHRSGVLAAGFQPSASSLLERRGDAADAVPPYVFSSGADGLVFLWSARPTVRALRFIGHRGPVYDCAWSPHAHLIASAGHDGFVRLWLPTLRRSGGLTAPSTNNNCPENYCHWRAHGGPVRSLAIAPHDDHLYTAGNDKSIKCWDLNYASSATSVKGGGNKFVCGFTGGHQNWVRTVAVSGGGASDSGLLPTHISLVASGGDDQTVQVWDPRSRRPTHTFYEHTGSVRSVDFHPDSCSLATGSADHTINVFDLRRNRLLQHYDAHDGGVNEVRFAPTGSWLLSASVDGAVKLWDLKEGYLYCTLNAHEGAVSTARFSDDGAYFTTAGQDGIVMVWRSGLPRVTPPYATYPNTHLYAPNNVQRHQEVSRRSVRNAAAEASTPAEIIPEATPRAMPGPTGPCSSIETSENRPQGSQSIFMKPRTTETVSKSQGNLPTSMGHSQFSYPSSSQKPPLPQPSSRPAATPATAAMVSAHSEKGVETHEGEVGNGRRPRASADGRKGESRKTFVFEREENEYRYNILNQPQTPNDEEGNEKEGYITGHTAEKGGYQKIHASELALAESVQGLGSGAVMGTSEMDDEMSVVEYVGKTCGEGEEESGSNGSAARCCRVGLPMSHRKQEEERINDRLRHLEELCAQLATEVQLAHEHSVAVTQELQKQWDAQQRQHRDQIDQLRQMMEGFVAQQGVLLQALRRE